MQHSFYFPVKTILSHEQIMEKRRLFRQKLDWPKFADSLEKEKENIWLLCLIMNYLAIHGRCGYSKVH